MRAIVVGALLALLIGLSLSPGATADTMQPPPATAGPVAVNSVPMFAENTIWYLNPRNFPTLGQSFYLAKPIKLTAVAAYVNTNITLLTPNGVKMMENPDNYSEEELEAERQALHLEDWPFEVRLTVRIFKHEDAIPTQFSVRDGTWALTAHKVQIREAQTDRALVTLFRNGPVLGPGNYLVAWTMEDVPKEILSITLSGTQEGRRGELRNYPGGAAYVAYAAYGGDIFNEHTTKTLDAAVAGRNDWCRGDLQIWVMGRSVKKGVPTTQGTMLTGGTRVEPFVPPVDVGTRCWANNHTLQPRL